MPDNNVESLWTLRADVDLKATKDLASDGAELLRVFGRLQDALKVFSKTLQDSGSVGVQALRTLRKDYESFAKTFESTPLSANTLGSFSRGTIDAATKGAAELGTRLQAILKPFDEISRGISKGFGFNAINKDADKFLDIIRAAGTSFETNFRLTRAVRDNVDKMITSQTKSLGFDQRRNTLLRTAVDDYIKAARSEDERLRRQQNAVVLQDRLNKQAAELQSRLTTAQTPQAQLAALGRMSAELRKILELEDASLRLNQQRKASLEEQAAAAARLRAVNLTTEAVQTQGANLDIEQRIKLTSELLKITQSRNLTERETIELAKTLAATIKAETAAQRALTEERKKQQALDKGTERASKEASYEQAAASLFRLAQAQGQITKGGERLAPLIQKVATEFSRGEITSSQLVSRFNQLSTQASATEKRLEALRQAQERLNNVKSQNAENIANQKRINIEEAVNAALLRRPKLLEASRKLEIDLGKLRDDAITKGIKRNQTLKEIEANFNRLIATELRRAASAKTLSDANRQVIEQEERLALLNRAAQEARITAALVNRAKITGLTSRADINLRQAIQQVTKAAIDQSLTLKDQERLLDSLVKKQIELAKVSQNNASLSGPGGISQIGQVIALQQVAVRLQAGLTDLVTRFSDFEKELTSVRKTAGATTEQMERLGLQLLDIGQTTPVAANDLAKIAGILGQVGALSFTETVNGLKTVEQVAVDAVRLIAEVSLATDLNAEQAAESYGQLRAVFAKDVERLTLTLTAFKGEAADTTDALRAMFGVMNEISNATVATVGDLNLFIRNFGGVASAAGLTFEQVNALGGAIRDLGVTPQVAGTALSRLFGEFSRKAEVFADALGITVDQWNALFNSNAQEASTRFFQALAGSTKQRQQDILNSIGAEQRLRNTLIKLSEGYNLVARNQRIASDTAAAYNSIQNEAGKFAETLDATFSRFSNTITELAVSFKGFMAVVQFSVNLLNRFLQAVISVISGLNDLGGSFLPLGDILTGVVGSLAAIAAAAASFFIAIQTLKFGGVLSGFSRLRERLTESRTAMSAAEDALYSQNKALLDNRRVLEQNRATVQARIAAMQRSGLVVPKLIAEEARLTQAINAETASIQRNTLEFQKNAQTKSRSIGLLGKLGRAATVAGGAIGGLTSAYSAFNSFSEGDLGGGLLDTVLSVGLLTTSIKGLGTAAVASAAATGAAVAVIAAGAAVIAASVAGAYTPMDELADRIATNNTSLLDSFTVFRARIQEAIGLYDGYTELLEEALRRQNELAGDRAQETQLISGLGAILTNLGASAAQANAIIQQVNEGTLSLADALAAVSVQRDSLTGVVTGLAIGGTLFQDAIASVDNYETALRAAGKTFADLQAQAREELGATATSNEVYVRAQALQQEELLARTASVRSQIIAQLQSQGKGEDEINKILGDRKNDLIGLLELGKQLRLVTGFNQEGDQFNLTSGQRNAERLRKELEDTVALQQRAQATAAATNELENKFRERTLSYSEAISEVEAGNVKSLERVVELREAIERLGRQNRELAQEELADTQAQLASERERFELEVERAGRQEALISRLIASRDKEEIGSERRKELEEQIADNQTRLNTRVQENLLRGQRIAALVELEGDLRRRNTLRVREQNQALEVLATTQEDLLKKAQDDVAQNIISGNEILESLIRDRLEGSVSAAERFSRDLLKVEVEIQDEIIKIREAGLLREEQLNAIAQELRLKALRKVQDLIIDRVQDEIDRVKEAREKASEAAIDAQEEENDRLKKAAEEREKILEGQLKAAQDYASKLNSFRSGLEGLLGTDDESLSNLLGFNQALEATKDRIDAVLQSAVELGGRDNFAKGISAGLAAIDREATKSARSLGILLAQQIGLEERINKSRLSGEKGDVAKEFIRRVREVSADTTITDTQREAQIAFFQERLRQIFDDLQGEAPALEDLLTLSDSLLQNDGKRVQTAQDVRDAIQEQITAVKAAKKAENDRLASYDQIEEKQAEINRLIQLASKVSSRNQQTLFAQDDQQLLRQAGAITGQTYRPTGGQQQTQALLQQIIADLQASLTGTEGELQRLAGTSEADIAAQQAEAALNVEKERNAASSLRQAEILRVLQADLEATTARLDALRESVGQLNLVSTEQLYNLQSQVNRTLQEAGAEGVNLDVGAITQLLQSTNAVRIFQGELADVIGDLSEVSDGAASATRNAANAIIQGFGQVRDDIAESNRALEDLINAVGGTR